MISAGIITDSTHEPAVSAPLAFLNAHARYREFQFGANLIAVSKQAHMKPSEAKVIHQRPAVIRELRWQAPLAYSSPGADSVKEIIFSFYNNELFRIVVTYDPERIEGMRVEDFVEAISAKYGTVSKPVAEITLSSTHLDRNGEKSILDRREKIIARWEDAQYSFDLFRPSYQSTFGMAMYSKRLDTLARAAIAEAIRLDTQEAPERETVLRKKKDEENRDKLEKARQVNKAPFRP